MTAGSEEVVEESSVEGQGGVGEFEREGDGLAHVDGYCGKSRRVKSKLRWTEGRREAKRCFLVECGSSSQ